MGAVREQTDRMMEYHSTFEGKNRRVLLTASSAWLLRHHHFLLPIRFRLNVDVGSSIVLAVPHSAGERAGKTGRLGPQTELQLPNFFFPYQTSPNRQSSRQFYHVVSERHRNVR